MLKNEYRDAKFHIIQAKEMFEKLDTSTPMLYCKIKKEFLNGYCIACEVPVEDHLPNLTHRLLKSTKDQKEYSVCNKGKNIIGEKYNLIIIYFIYFQDIIQILQEDNIVREIPQVYRDNLELDLQGALAHRKIIVAKDLLLQIQCLNLVRRILDNQPVLGDYINNIKVAGLKGVKTLFWVN